jgi:type IV pilus assembly protein PilP
VKAPLIAAVLLSTLLAGCGRGMDDLEQWVAEVKGRKSTQIEPIPQIKQYEAFVYNTEGRRDPFVAVEPERTQTAAAGPRPDLNRNKEPLEEFPLDALRMQGTIKTTRATFALVKAPDGVIHRVTVGNHMGQNYGQIKAISESEVALAEIVPDGFGGWVQRPAVLALTE